MIFSYDNFLLNESVLYYSPKVRDLLKKIDDPIAQDLISLETTDLPIDVTFVDIDSNREGYLTFTTMKSANKYLEPNSFDKIMNTTSSKFATTLSDRIWNDKEAPFIKSRNPIKLGKFVNNLLPNKYGEKDRESFVNKFKAKLDASGEKFILVDGDDINFYYDERNYKKEKGGSLNSSCMKDETGIFDLYVSNPEVCRLLVLLEDELVIGRALIWKLDYITDDYTDYFMDRQYTIKDSDVEKFREYATKEGWAYKDENRHSSFQGIVFEGEVHSVTMEVSVKRKNYDYFPYMDTFRSFEHNDCTLINANMVDDPDYYLLDGVSGEYTNNRDVWSEYLEETIDRDNAIWSEPLNSYIYDNNCVHVEKGIPRNQGYWPGDHKEIRYDEWNDEYIHEDDSVYSEEYSYCLYDEDAVSVINELEENGDANVDSYYMHYEDPDIIKIDELSDLYWYKCLFIENPDNNWDYHTHKIDKSLNLFNTDKITDEFVNKFKGIDMLTEEDAGKYAEPDTLEFDIHMVKTNDGTEANPDNLKLNVNITYGDNHVSKFTISKPGEVEVVHYSGFGSKYDEETEFGFEDDSLKELITFFNRFGFKLDTKDFTFIDKYKDSYVYTESIKLTPNFNDDYILVVNNTKPQKNRFLENLINYLKGRGIKYIVVSNKEELEKNNNENVTGAILTGSEYSLCKPESNNEFSTSVEALKTLKCPILAMDYGMLIMGKENGAKVLELDKIYDDSVLLTEYDNNGLFNGIDLKNTQVSFEFTEYLGDCPQGFKTIAKVEDKIVGIANNSKNHYGFLFYPEDIESTQPIIDNFIKLCSNDKDDLNTIDKSKNDMKYIKTYEMFRIIKNNKK